MSSWPKMFTPDKAPREVIALAEQLVPKMIAGDHPALEALRVQHARARIASVELTGVGFYVNYQVPDDAPRANPPDFQGGNARIEAEGMKHGCGCVLFVRGGQIAFLEGYTYDEVWSVDTKVLSVKDVQPLDPPPESSA